MTYDPVGRIRIMIVDDHLMFCESLTRLLGDEEDLVVVGTASTGEEALELAPSLQPDVVLMDYRLPGMDGAELTRELILRDQTAAILMLTGYADERVLRSAIEAGCCGIISKDRAAAEIVHAVRFVTSGVGLPLPLTKPLFPLQLASRRPLVGGDLTDREREILALLANGSSNVVIAADLFLSVNTVRNYVQSILRKLRAHTRLEAVAVGVREGIVNYPRRP